MNTRSTFPDLEAPGWDPARIPHGFAAHGQPVAAGFQLVRVHQVHGATADCVPVLLAAPEAGAVAAVHAGWRGTVASIAAVGVRALVERGARAEDVRAALGPSIDGCCYEIEREIAERFANDLGSRIWSAWREGERPGKGHLDLRRVNALVLADAGVPEDSIARVGPCTYCGGGPFASFRREGAAAGRQLSWIALPAA